MQRILPCLDPPAPEAVLSTQPDPARRNSFGQPGGADGPPPGMMAPSTVRSPVQSRPVYPYPAVSRYSCRGDPLQAASQQAGARLFTGPLPAWIGSGLFAPYRFQD